MSEIVLPPDERASIPVPARYLPTLDGWRAVAIAGVMISHALSSQAAKCGVIGVNVFFGIKCGVIGVNIFFGISGFLICSRLLEERQRSGRINLSAFYIRRTFRIFPPYFLYLSVVGMLTAAGVLNVTRWEFLSCVTFLRNYLHEPASNLFAGWYTGHFWSLAVEEHFYLIWPSLLILLGVPRARWAVVPLALGIGAWRIVEYRLQLLSRVLVGVPFYARTDVNLDGLFWGCWLALLLDDPAWRDRLTRWLTTWAWLGLIAAFAGSVWIKPQGHVIVEAALIPFLLVGTVLRPGTVVGRVLEFPPLRWVGRLSYSLYLWQQLFLIDDSANRATILRPLQALPISLLATLACALASFHLIERPMIRLGRFCGGFSTKIHITVDAPGNPAALILRAGQEADVSQAEPLIAGHEAGACIADKA